MTSRIKNTTVSVVHVYREANVLAYRLAKINIDGALGPYFCFNALDSDLSLIVEISNRALPEGCTERILDELSENVKVLGSMEG